MSSLIVLLVMSALSGCKYEEGPWISFRSHENRLVNSWKYTFMQFNGANGLTGNGPGSINFDLSTIGFNDEGRFSVTWRKVDSTASLFTGNWSFADSDETLILDFDDTSQSQQVFTIVKLKNDELWLEEKIGDDLFEYHLEGEE